MRVLSGGEAERDALPRGLNHNDYCNGEALRDCRATLQE